MSKVLNECIKRLEILKNQGLITDLDIVEGFKNGKFFISEPNVILGQPCGIIFNIEQKNHYNKIFKNTIIDEMNFISDGVTPYFAIAQNTSYGLLFSVFYVSANEENWEQERQDLESQSPCAYIYNIDDDFGEFGYISYKMCCGGPVRIS